MRKLIIFCTLFCFIVSSANSAYAQASSVPAAGIISLPTPGQQIELSRRFEPSLIKGLTVHKDNPFLFDFIIDTGHTKLTAQDELLKAQADRLIKYFFACLTIPENDLWVNLSPYEKDRIAPDALAKTALGTDLLAQDYILKQVTASMIDPQKRLGQEFWDRIYAKVQMLYGTTTIPVNTFNKVWILADKATVYERGQTAYVVGGHLKVMLEEDYDALRKNKQESKSPKGLPAGQAGMTTDNNAHTLGSQIVREIVIPELEREVNEGENFATLRQIYNSLILASWYKKNLKQALLNQVYSDKNTVKGLTPARLPLSPQQIYQQYLQAYKKGVFNLIKEDKQADGQVMPRKYFSGGFGVDRAMLNVTRDPAIAKTAANPTGALIEVAVALNMNEAGLEDLSKAQDLAVTQKSTDAAMTSWNDEDDDERPSFEKMKPPSFDSRKKKAEPKERSEERDQRRRDNFEDRKEELSIHINGLGDISGGGHVYTPSKALTELAAHYLPDDFSGDKVLDIGTGSGVFGLLMRQRNAYQVVMTDVKEEALDAARANARNLGFDLEDGRLRFVRSDMFAMLPKELFHAIVFTPSPIDGYDASAGELARVYKYVKHVKAFFKEAGRYLAPRSRIVFRHTEFPDDEESMRHARQIEGFVNDFAAREGYNVIKSRSPLVRRIQPPGRGQRDGGQMLEEHSYVYLLKRERLPEDKAMLTAKDIWDAARSKFDQIGDKDRLLKEDIDRSAIEAEGLTLTVKVPWIWAETRYKKPGTMSQIKNALRQVGEDLERRYPGYRAQLNQELDKTGALFTQFDLILEAPQDKAMASVERFSGNDAEYRKLRRGVLEGMLKRLSPDSLQLVADRRLNAVPLYVQSPLDLRYQQDGGQANVIYLIAQELLKDRPQGIALVSELSLSTPPKIGISVRWEDVHAVHAFLTAKHAQFKDEAMTAQTAVVQQRKYDAKILVNGQDIPLVGSGGNVDVYGPALVNGRKAAIRIYRNLLEDELRRQILENYALGASEGVSPGIIADGETLGADPVSWIAVDWTEAKPLSGIFEARGGSAQFKEVWTSAEKELIERFLIKLKERGTMLLDIGPLNMGLEERTASVVIIDAELFVRDTYQQQRVFSQMYDDNKRAWDEAGLGDVFERVYASWKKDIDAALPEEDPLDFDKWMAEEDKAMSVFLSDALVRDIALGLKKVVSSKSGRPDWGSVKLVESYNSWVAEESEVIREANSWLGEVGSFLESKRIRTALDRMNLIVRLKTLDQAMNAGSEMDELVRSILFEDSSQIFGSNTFMIRFMAARYVIEHKELFKEYEWSSAVELMDRYLKNSFERGGAISSIAFIAIREVMNISSAIQDEAIKALKVRALERMREAFASHENIRSLMIAELLEIDQLDVLGDLKEDIIQAFKEKNQRLDFQIIWPVFKHQQEIGFNVSEKSLSDEVKGLFMKYKGRYARTSYSYMVMYHVLDHIFSNWRTPEKGFLQDIRKEAIAEWKKMSRSASLPHRFIAEFLLDKHPHIFNWVMETDAAMSGVVTNSYGGIDLDSRRLKMQVRRDSKGMVSVNVDPALIEHIRSSGIGSATPVIIRISPLLDARPLLGLD